MEGTIQTSTAFWFTYRTNTAFTEAIEPSLIRRDSNYPTPMLHGGVATKPYSSKTIN